jgi:hypothetical protein
MSAMALAGCVGGDVEPESAAAPVAFDEDTGAVRGSVLDGELRPVSGALVAILDVEGQFETNTDEEGKFGLSNVPPGTYRLAVQKLGYASAAKSIDVTAGSETTAEFNLEVIPIEEPYVESLSHAGQYGTGAAIVLTTACYGCNNPDRAWFMFGGYPDDFAGMVVEARWDTADYLGFDLLARQGICGEDNESSCIWYRTRSQSPMHFFVEPCGDYTGPPTYGATRFPCGQEEFERNRGTDAGDGAVARIETWYIGLLQEETHTADPACTVLYAAGCYGVGLAPETRWETWVSIFHLELPEGAESFSAFPDG